MGQQIQFRTLDDVAEGLLRAAPAAAGAKPVARTVALGDERLSRLELTLRVGDAERDVHIYEAYWAPLTEGRVTIRDVAGFLLRSGLGSVKLGRSNFRRWLFDAYEEFEAPVRSALYLVTALAVIASLGFLNVLIVAIAAARAPLRDPPAWLGPAMFRDVTTVLNFLVSAIVPFAALMLVWVLTQRWKWTIPGWLTIPTFLLAVWATLAAGVTAAEVVLYHAAFASDPQSSLFDRMAGLGAIVRRFDAWFDIIAHRAFIAVVVGCLIRSAVVAALAIGRSLRKPQNSRGFTIAVTLGFILLFASLGRLGWYLFQHARLAGGAAEAIGHGLAWPLVVVVAAVVRSFLVQYVGDVAAYVQPQVVDRFYVLRQEIKNTVWKTARAVYGATQYDDIILVGHSLGSVVMYDALNRLLIDRELAGGDPEEIASRTRLMLTFGSPLDKTAFIYATQGTGSEAREALAASVQPLIEREALRPRWVNIYSRWDIISGPLDYYDRRDRSNRNPVENVKDDKASTLLTAHVEYWRNPKLFETIVAALASSEVEQAAHLHNERLAE
jgi:hypothetical protein